MDSSTELSSQEEMTTIQCGFLTGIEGETLESRRASDINAAFGDEMVQYLLIGVEKDHSIVQIPAKYFKRWKAFAKLRGYELEPENSSTASEERSYEDLPF